MVAGVRLVRPEEGQGILHLLVVLQILPAILLLAVHLLLLAVLLVVLLGTLLLPAVLGPAGSGLLLELKGFHFFFRRDSAEGSF